MVLHAIICYNLQLLSFLRSSAPFALGYRRFISSGSSLNLLRNSTQYFVSRFRNLTCSNENRIPRKYLWSARRKEVTNSQINVPVADKRVLFGAQRRGEEETINLFRPRKRLKMQWIISLSLIVLTYESLKIIYSWSRFMTFPRPPKPFTQLFNRWKWIVPKSSKLKFSDVVGCDEAKAELRTIVQALTSPESFTRVGAHPPRGVLLVGPPGVGKTLLARAVAGEAKVTFLHANGSEFDGSVVGDGARRIRELFSLARARAPCIVFIDGVDSVCPRRAEVGGEATATLTTNQFLVEMDGLLSDNRQSNRTVVVLGATSRDDLVDPAALRDGRFETRIHLRPPGADERLRMLRSHLERVAHAPIPTALLEEVAARGAGMTGADLANVVNRAAILAGLAKAERVTGEHLVAALDHLQGGLERRVCLDEVTRYSKAVHEAGHAVLARFTKHAPAVCRVSILPTSTDDSHGRTCLIPDETDRPLTKTELLARLDVLLGGRMAEEELLGFENVSCTAAVDLEKASRIAIKMVRNYGMSACVGLRSLPLPCSSGADGDSVETENALPDVSSRLEAQIDAEISRLLWESCKRARLLIRARLKELKRVVTALETYETLDAEDLSAVLIGGVPKAGVERESEAERNITRWSNF